MKKIGVLAGAVCLLVVAGLWFWRFQITEEERVQISDKVYSAGEAVPFGENFFWSNSENPNGYTITVDSAQTRNVREFLEENGTSWEEVYPETEYALSPSEVVYLVTATVTNEGNEDGMVQFSNFVMTSGSILLQLDGTLNNYLPMLALLCCRLAKAARLPLHLPQTAPLWRQMRNPSTDAWKRANSICAFPLCRNEG